MYVTPATVLFPETNKQLYNLLLLNETVWILEVARRLLLNAKPDEDKMAVAVEYIKSFLFLDLVASVP